MGRDSLDEPMIGRITDSHEMNRMVAFIASALMLVPLACVSPAYADDTNGAQQQGTHVTDTDKTCWDWSPGDSKPACQNSPVMSLTSVQGGNILIETGGGHIVTKDGYDLTSPFTLSAKDVIGNSDYAILLIDSLSHYQKEKVGIYRDGYTLVGWEFGPKGETTSFVEPTWYNILVPKSFAEGNGTFVVSPVWHKDSDEDSQDSNTNADGNTNENYYDPASPPSNSNENTNTNIDEPSSSPCDYNSDSYDSSYHYEGVACVKDDEPQDDNSDSTASSEGTEDGDAPWFLSLYARIVSFFTGNDYKVVVASKVGQSIDKPNAGKKSVFDGVSSAPESKPSTVKPQHQWIITN